MKSTRFIWAALVAGFILFSTSIYIQPALDKTTHGNSISGAEGKLVWQKYNCQACHQIYGLGGYLGPDLTNVYSQKGKGPSYILGMVQAGSRQMPSFQLTQEEQAKLLQFLRVADLSGSADPRDFVTTPSGMIERK